MQALLIFLLVAVSLFMILLILIQRGKGGGLAGAFGGMGGQSAFGTKAGDTFTKITIWTVLFWFSLCVSTLVILSGRGCPGSGLNVNTERRAAPTQELPLTGETSPETTIPTPPPAEPPSAE